MVQQIWKLIIISSWWSKINFVADKNHWNSIIDFDDPRHPILFQSLDAVNIVNIIDKNDNICFFYLTISILLILLMRTWINQLCVDFVWEKVVVRRDCNCMVSLNYLPWEVVWYYCYYDWSFADTLCKYIGWIMMIWGLPSPRKRTLIFCFWVLLDS
jgi:hypothetical protein